MGRAYRLANALQGDDSDDESLPTPPLETASTTAPAAASQGDDSDDEASPTTPLETASTTTPAVALQADTDGCDVAQAAGPPQQTCAEDAIVDSL